MNALNNPFATDRVERVLAFQPEWARTTWKEIDLRWQTLNQRATLTGRHGSGKTTFLDAWEGRLANSEHKVISLFLNRELGDLSSEEWRALENCDGKTIVLDGEEQLNWRARRRFYRLTSQCAGLLIARHSKGKLPTLLHLDPDIDLLHRCVRELSPNCYPKLAPLFSMLWKKRAGNLRSILLDCYDAVSGFE